ncbi:MAG: hypothetical protein AB7P49_10140, partial [Bdellovibrionales bacterium]
MPLVVLITLLALVTIAIGSVSPRLWAQPDPALLNQRLEALESRLRLLEDENAARNDAPSANPLFESARRGLSAGRTPGPTYLGTSSTKAYSAAAGTWTLGLSTEFFTFTENHGAENRSNVLSLAPAIGYRLHPRIVFISQILFENGGAESSNTVTLQKGQAVVLMAYADWLTDAQAHTGVRLGHQLVPLGFVNTQFEPMAYFSVQRPELERELIPSLWHENGLSFWLDRPRADLQIGIFNSLDAHGFRKDSFLGGGRNHGQNAASDDLMGVARLNLKGRYTVIGGSFASGSSARVASDIPHGAFKLGELHVRLSASRWRLSAMAARGELDDADVISLVNSTAMGSRAQGHSLEAAVDVLEGAPELWLFARYARYNLHDSVAEGQTLDP